MIATGALIGAAVGMVLGVVGLFVHLGKSTRSHTAPETQAGAISFSMSGALLGGAIGAIIGLFLQ